MAMREAIDSQRSPAAAPQTVWHDRPAFLFIDHVARTMWLGASFIALPNRRPNASTARVHEYTLSIPLGREYARNRASRSRRPAISARDSASLDVARTTRAALIQSGNTRRAGSRPRD